MTENVESWIEIALKLISIQWSYQIIYFYENHVLEWMIKNAKDPTTFLWVLNANKSRIREGIELMAIFGIWDFEIYCQKPFQITIQKAFSDERRNKMDLCVGRLKIFGIIFFKYFFSVFIHVRTSSWKKMIKWENIRKKKRNNNVGNPDSAHNKLKALIKPINTWYTYVFCCFGWKKSLKLFMR